jgi:hypothetical protein
MKPVQILPRARARDLTERSAKPMPRRMALAAAVNQSDAFLARHVSRTRL